MQRMSSAWQSISTQGSSTWQQLRYGSRSQSRRTSRESAAGGGAGAAAVRQLALERPYASTFHERIERCESVLDQIARQHRRARLTSRSPRSRFPFQSSLSSSSSFLILISPGHHSHSIFSLPRLVVGSFDCVLPNMERSSDRLWALWLSLSLRTVYGNSQRALFAAMTRWAAAERSLTRALTAIATACNSQASAIQKYVRRREEKCSRQLCCSLAA